MGAGAGAGAGGRSGGRSQGSGLAKRGGGVIGKSAGRAGGSFTEGGSGLGRNRPNPNADGRPGTAMGAGGAAGTRKKDRKDGTRPDYLVEDEDTWANSRPVNPPVIE
jgi:hypothetical protein